MKAVPRTIADRDHHRPLVVTPADGIVALDGPNEVVVKIFGEATGGVISVIEQPSRREFSSVLTSMTTTSGCTCLRAGSA